MCKRSIVLLIIMFTFVAFTIIGCLASKESYGTWEGAEDITDAFDLLGVPPANGCTYQTIHHDYPNREYTESEYIGDDICIHLSDDYVPVQDGLPFHDKISGDFLGNFTIVAYCWDGYNYNENIGPRNKGDEMRADIMEGYIDPATCIGYHVCIVSTNDGYETNLLLSNMTSVFLAQNSDIGVYQAIEQKYPDVMAVVVVLSRYLNLANALDLSEEYMLHWRNGGEFYIFKLAREAFPELSMDSDMRRNIEYLIESILVIDENHLLLAPGIWNVLAVRDSHLEEGCNYMTIHGNDLIFSRNIP